MEIIPQPMQLIQKPGSFTFTPDVVIVAPGPAAPLGKLFSSWLKPATGAWLPVQASSGKTKQTIHLKINQRMTRLGVEGYRLSITPDRIEAVAAQEAGLFYGMQTLRQLFPFQVYRAAPVGAVDWRIPCVEIEDQPRFTWRGLHLDVCRHFMPKSFILKLIDLIALHKLNTFHWHLTEDQGWRIEIKRYPRLTEVGAWRKETLVGHWSDNPEQPRFDGKPHGGFYTQEDVREVVAYAKERFVTVVPEIEMPGHCQAAIAAYPELGNTGRQIEVSTSWGIFEDVFNVDEGTIVFLQNVLDEVLRLFPSTYIHIGGDEVPKKHWQENPAAQKRMHKLGLKNEEELQSYFVRRMDNFLTERGRRLVGWDEILEGGLATNATVMSWRGEAGGIAAANSGHDVVMAPNQYTYLDYFQGDPSHEPLAFGNYLPLEKVYGYEPVPAGLNSRAARHVLGAQAQLWTEYMPDYRRVEYMAFPRLCALAEVVWTPLEKKDYADFTQRLVEHKLRLVALDVNFKR
jgi:hexosaminidase